MESKLSVQKIRRISNLIQMRKNKSEIAQDLEIDRKTLNRWIEKGYKVNQRLANEHIEGTYIVPKRAERLYISFYSAILTAEFLRILEYEELYGDNPWPPIPKTLSSFLWNREEDKGDKELEWKWN